MVSAAPEPAFRRPQRAVPRRQAAWTVAAVVAGGLAALQFGSLTILWFLPYHLTGLANETGLLLVAVTLGMVALYLLRRSSLAPVAGRAAFCIAAVLYAVASFAGLGWSEGRLAWGAYRYTLFSETGCDFTARFRSPPQFGRFKSTGFEVDRGNATLTAKVAILADLKTFSAYRAECQPIAGDAAPATTRAVAQAAALRWAEESGVKIASQSLANDARGDILHLEGEIGGSILAETPERKSRTLIGVRSYIGKRSIMTVYVFQPQGDVLTQQSLAFLDGVQRR